jgi:hypothetical protein
MTEYRRDVYEEPADPTDRVVVSRRTEVERPATRVVTQVPQTGYVRDRDPLTTATAASRMIQTVVWAVVVLAILIVGILVLVHYNII